MDRASLLFCALSLAVSLLIAVICLPLASLSTAELQASQALTPAEEMGELDLGDFGSVSVLELVDYYLENPPAPPAAGAAAVRAVRFQGC
ncbi:MAG: hypothetical protein KDI68_07535 [Gammaproteobacteria bacterium]|nr:hypothetical protein [Gammaproteobacteria bacterium]